MFKFLIRQDKMTDQLFELLWSSSKTEMVTDIIKVIQDCSNVLEVKHQNFFIDQIVNQAAEKISDAEFELLCELGTKQG